VRLRRGSAAGLKEHVHTCIPNMSAITGRASGLQALSSKLVKQICTGHDCY